MARGGFKAKTYAEVVSVPKKKKKPVARRIGGSKSKVKAKKKPIKYYKTKLWQLCKTLVRKRDGNVCVICCKANLEGSGWHTGHFIPSSTCGAFLRYDLRNLHSSCYNCNINLGGNGALFLIKLEEVYGRNFVDAIVSDKNNIIKADKIFYESKIEAFKEMESWSKDKLFDYTKIHTGG